MSSTAINLRSERERRGLSQAKLAELTGISQHMLSAFELGKAPVPEKLLQQLELALADTNRVEALVSRRKRYQSHEYEDVKRLADRIAKASRTPGNEEYLAILNRLGVKHAKKSNKDLRALSLFSGCGGFSLGFSAAGFEVAGFLELGDGLREIYRENFPTSIEMGSDITKVSKESLDSFASQIGEIDAIIGGPPCQGFSLSGKRRVDDPRNSLFRHYLRFVDAFKPKIAVLENVRLLTSMKSPNGGYVKDEISNEFKKHGYLIQHFEIDAMNYGVPQHRERVLFVAVREDAGIYPSLPDDTHGNHKDLFGSVEPFRTFADACSDLAYLESGEQSDDALHVAVKHPAHVIKWLWDVKEGFSAHDNEDENLRPPSGYNTTYKRQVWNEPASTVQTTFGMISGCRNVHPIATRSLTIREAARIQSFPDNYVFKGTLGTIRTGIGNAVPPLLSNAIANHVRQLLTRG
jgi:DNA (cytosine-5)-methyltransferase 1